MRNLSYAILFFLLVNLAYGNDMQSVFSQTLSQSKGYQRDSYNSIKGFKPASAFNHFTDHPSQNHYYQGVTGPETSAMNQDAFNSMSSTDTGKVVMSSINQHPKFSITPNSPDMQHSSLIQSEADHIVHGVISQYTDCKPKQACQMQYKNQTCSAPSLNQHPTCRKNKIVSARLPDNAIQTIAVNIQALPSHKLLPTVEVTIDLLNARVILAKGKVTQLVVSPALQSVPCDELAVSLVSAQSNDQKYPVKIDITKPPTCQNHFQLTVKLSSEQWFMSRAMDVTLTYRFVAKLAPVTQDSWTNGCNYLEQLRRQGICQLQKPDSCVRGQSTRVINGIPITRDCWATQSTYDCAVKAATNQCAVFEEQGCEQTGSTCQDKIGDLCVTYQQTYRCPVKLCVNTVNVNCGDGKDYCLDGSCVDHTYQPSPDFAKSVSALSAVQDASKTFNPQGNFIFKGHLQQCRDEAGDFSNCCNQRGWGQDLKLAHCNEEEKSLGPNREHGISIYVGRYCSDYFPWPLDHICKEHKQSYCVFGSKLARIIQQQGKNKQLHIGFGKAEHPRCDGLSPQQLQKINFSKIDFQDFYADLNSKIKKPDLNQIKQSIQQHIDQYREAGQPND